MSRSLFSHGFSGSQNREFSKKKGKKTMGIRWGEKVDKKRFGSLRSNPCGMCGKVTPFLHMVFPMDTPSSICESRVY
jgi:hypothetical protein